MKILKARLIFLVRFHELAFRVWTWRSPVLSELFFSSLDLETSYPYWVARCESGLGDQLFSFSWLFESGLGDQLSLVSCSFRIWTWRSAVLGELFFSSLDLEISSPYWVIRFESGSADQGCLVNCLLRVRTCSLTSLWIVCLFRVWASRSAILSFPTSATSIIYVSAC